MRNETHTFCHINNLENLCLTLTCVCKVLYCYLGSLLLLTMQSNLLYIPHLVKSAMNHLFPFTNLSIGKWIILKGITKVKIYTHYFSLCVRISC